MVGHGSDKIKASPQVGLNLLRRKVACSLGFDGNQKVQNAARDQFQLLRRALSLVKVFSSHWQQQKRSLYYFYFFLGNFRCSELTSVTFISDLSKVEEKKNPKNIHFLFFKSVFFIHKSKNIQENKYHVIFRSYQIFKNQKNYFFLYKKYQIL